MAIYISGVKGLPEQVQANKEDIQQIKEDIANIDFDAIRELETQVGENTQDINNLEASIGVQNQAINNLKDDVDALESKTQKITYDEQADELTIDTDTTIKRLVISTPNTPLRADSMVSRDDNNAISLTGADDEISLIVGRNATQHILKFNADGSLDIDGQAVGKTYYRHIIGFAYNNFYYNFEVISTKSTAYTQVELRNYLKQWNDGTFLSQLFQLIGVDANYNPKTALLSVNENNYYFYNLNGTGPQTLTSLSQYKDTCHEI